MCFSLGLKTISLADFLTKENGTSVEVPSSNNNKYVFKLTATIFPKVPSSNLTFSPTLNFSPFVIKSSSDSLRLFFWTDLT